MSGLIDAATAVMRTSSQRLDNAAVNVANVSTPGFKRRLRPSDVTSAMTRNRIGPPFDAALAKLRVDLNAGKLSETGRPLDLAITGDGFFAVRAGERTLYSRHGAFALAADGRVVTPQGHALQQAGGGDLVLESAAVTIAADGTVLSGDRPVAKVGVFAARDADAMSAIDGSLFAIAGDAAEPVAIPQLRQGAVEASNVSLGDEMVGMMGAMRGAETGARLVQVYDDLMGKAISAFGQSGR